MERRHGTGHHHGRRHLWLDGKIAFQNVRALPAENPEVRAVWIVGDEINIAKSPVNLLDDDKSMRFSAFRPRYDEEGNALPMDITFTADVELRPGTDLRRVFRNVRRLPKSFDPRVDGDLLMRGNFDSNLARVVTVPGEDVRPGLSVHVNVE